MASARTKQNRYIFSEAGEQVFKDFQDKHLKYNRNDSEETQEFKTDVSKAFALLIKLNTSNLAKETKRAMNNFKVSLEIATVGAAATHPIEAMQDKSSMKELGKHISRDNPLTLIPHGAEQLDITKFYVKEVLEKLPLAENLTGTAKRPFTTAVASIINDAITAQHNYTTIEEATDRQEKHDKVARELKAVAKIEFNFKNTDTATATLTQILSKAAPFELLQQNDDYATFSCQCSMLCDPDKPPENFFKVLSDLVNMQLTTCEAVQPPNNANTMFKGLLKALQTGISALNTVMESNNTSGKTTPADDFSERSISSAPSSTLFGAKSLEQRSRSNSSDATNESYKDSTATPPQNHQERPLSH